MMQIHIDAIEKSRVSDTQYVLRKSLDMACVSDKKKLLKYLKDGWEIVGKYHNGVGYDDYKITDEKEISCIKNFLEKELFGFKVKSASTVHVSFQEVFEPITCESEDLIAFITFFNTVDGILEHENFRFYGDNASKIRDFVFGLNIKHDKATVIDLIEKKNKMKGEEKQMVSRVGAKEFKRRVIGKIKQIDNTVKDDDLFFSQTAIGYCLEYKPNYPDSSEKDLIVCQDLNGSISVHGNGNSLYPGVNTFEDISDFEFNTNCKEKSNMKIQSGNTYTFTTTESGLLKYNGTKVKVIRPLTEKEADTFEVGKMYKVAYEDGTVGDVFEEELS